MYKPDFSRTELVREFRDNPIGTHSPDLQYLLNFMRKPSGLAYYVLVWNGFDERWTLALLKPGGRGRPELTDVAFDSVADAEWYVFKLRWRALAGSELDLD